MISEKKSRTEYRFLILIFVLLVFFSNGEITFAGLETPKILILNSYHYGYAFSDNETKGIVETLQDVYPGLEPYIEYLDCKNFSDMKHIEIMKELFIKKYSNIKFSLIITLDDPAFVFIKKYREEVFGNVQVVFCGVNNFKDEMLKGYHGYTGVSEGMDIAENVKVMLQHFPETKEIFMVHDNTISGLAIRDEAVEQVKKIKADVKYTYSKDFSINELLDYFGKLNNNTLVLILAFNRDKNGEFFNFDRFTEIASSVLKVPFYGTREEMLGHGIIGGKIIGGKGHAEYAAEIAIKILKGEKAESIPVYKGSTSRFIFDYNKLKKFDISEKMLPTGSVIINKPVTFYHKYYVYIWLIIGAFLFLIIVIMILSVNIIRRKKAETAFYELKQRMQLSLQLTDSSAFEDNFKTGEVILSPAAFIKMGYTEEEVPKNINELMNLTHPDDFVEVQKAIEKHAMGESENYYAEFRMKAKNGDWIWHSGSGKIIEFDIDGKPLRLVGLSQAITERKVAQERIIKYAEELKEINAGKDKFFSIIAHDLKSPFLGLLGFSNVLSKNLDELSTEEIKKYAGYINKATRSIYELIEQLLAWSRLQTGRVEFSPKKINLNEICENTFNVLLNNARGKNIELVDELLPETFVNADENMTRSVLHNLISNAIKFSNRGGVIKIKAEKQGDFLAVSVIDFGVGMKNADLGKLFRLDEQLTTKGTAGEEGTGLGLVLCKEMVGKHNGHIHAESEIGKGSKFTFTLPSA